MKVLGFGAIFVKQISIIDIFMSIRAFLVKIYRDFNFFLYHTVWYCSPRVAQLPSEILFIITIYTYLLKEV